MAETDPFKGLLARNRQQMADPRMGGYVSPFASIDTSKWVDAPIAPPPPRKKSGAEKTLKFLKSVPGMDAINAAGERFGTNLIKDTLEMPEFVRNTKYLTPGQGLGVDKLANKVADKYVEKVKKPLARTYTPDQKILDKSKIGDTIGTGVTIANDVASLAEGGIGLVKGGIKLAGKSPKIARELEKVPWSKIASKWDNTVSSKMPWNKSRGTEVVTPGGKKAAPTKISPSKAKDAVDITPGKTPDNLINALAELDVPSTPKVSDVPAFQRRTKTAPLLTPEDMPARQRIADDLATGTKRTPVTTPEDALRTNADRAARMTPEVKDAFARTNSKDSLTLITDVLANTKNRSKVQNILSDLLPDVPTSARKALTEAVRKADTADKVTEELLKASKLEPNLREQPRIQSNNLDIPAYRRMKVTSGLPGTEKVANTMDTPAYLRRQQGYDLAPTDRPKLPQEDMGVPAYQRKQAGEPFAPDTPAPVPSATPNLPKAPGAFSAHSTEQTPTDLATAIADVQAPPTRKVNAPTQGPPKNFTIQKDPNWAQKTLESSRGQLDKAGEGGAEAAQRVRAVRDTSELAQTAFVQKIPTVLSLGKKDFAGFVDALDALSKGKTLQGVPKHVAEAIEEWRNVIPTVRQAAEKAGIDVGDLGEYYFPRVYSDALKNKGAMERFAQQLVKTGQAEDIGKAMEMMRFMKNRTSTRFGHFENSRMVDLPDYDKNKNALISYISSAFDRIADAEQFGAKGEKAQELLSKISAEGHDPVRAFRNLSIARGTYNYDQPNLEKWSKGARSFNRLRQLGLSAVLNLGQGTNTNTVYGILRTNKSAFKALTKGEKQYVKDTGVILDSVLQAMREQSGVAGKVTGKLTAPGFNTVERFNRSVAAVASRSYANDMAKKAAKGNASAIRALKKLGIDKPPKSGKLSYEQQVMAGRRGVELTQFRVDPQDLPGWADSPGGKLVTQFKSFTYKQTKFMYDEVIKEATKHGNFAPLLRFVTVGGVLGYGTGEVRSSLRGQGGFGGLVPAIGEENPNKADNPAETLLQALGNVGAFGMGGDVKFLAEHAGSPRFGQYLGSTIGGPTAGLALETLSNAGSAAQGNFTPMGRQALSDIPVAGPAVQQAALPYKSRFTDNQQKMLDTVPPEKRDAYEKALDDMKHENKAKSKVVEKVKRSISNGDLNTAGRYADEQNNKVYDKISELESQLGPLPDDMRSYLESFKVNYDYYYKKRFDE